MTFLCASHRLKHEKILSIKVQLHTAKTYKTQLAATKIGFQNNT